LPDSAPNDLAMRLRRVSGRNTAPALMARFRPVLSALVRTVRPPIRRGTLARSVRVLERADRTGVALGIQAGGPPPYAGLQDTGGRVVARGGWLAIPLDSIRSGGIPLYRSPRQDPDITHVYKAPSGKLFLAGRRGRGMQLRWLLTRQVIVKGTGYLRKAGKKLEDQAERVIFDTLDEAICGQ